MIRHEPEPRHRQRRNIDNIPWVHIKTPPPEIPEDCKDLAGLVGGAPTLSEEDQLAIGLRDVKCDHVWVKENQYYAEGFFPIKYEVFGCSRCNCKKRLCIEAGYFYPSVSVFIPASEVKAT